MIVKPSGPECNLDCTYCYYLEKKVLYPQSQKHQMSESLLEEFIRQYIKAQPASVVSFIWQGGEPCLRGLDFYKKAVSLQQKYATGKRIENIFQTNGTLINEDWCKFFHEHNFLIGISIDGPEELHNKFRMNRAGNPVFRKIMQSIDLFHKHRVNFNTLCTVNQYNSDYPLEIYRFLKSIDSHFIQFIPVVERLADRDQEHGLKLVSNEFKMSASIVPWTVGSLQFGKFMCTVFDEWVKNDVGQYFIQLFDTTLANYLGEPPGVCMYAPACGNTGSIEHNGDVYSCDHFTFPEYKLGNIQDTPLGELMTNTQQQLFGQNKYSQLPEVCIKCAYLDLCNGECPKKRFLASPSGEPGMNYLCEGYQLFFSHVDTAMQFMADEIRNQRQASNIMDRYS